MKRFLQKKVPAPGTPRTEHSPGPCLNCGAMLRSDDLFCPQCGQKRIENEDVSFGKMIGESIMDYFHFDSKFFRTLIPLLFKPGWLTLEFMKGRRKTYAEPFKLFLVISVIFFLLLSLNKDDEEKPLTRNSAGTENPGKAHSMLTPNHIVFTSGGKTFRLEAQDSMKKEIDTIGIPAYVNKHYAGQGGVSKFVIRQILKIMIVKGQSFEAVLEHTASKLIFLLIPVFALLLKLLYIRRKRLYFEHLVFSLHLHSFFFIILILYLLIEFIVPVKLFFILILFLIYTFFAMKKFYGQKTGKTFGKLLLLSMTYLVIALPVFFFLLAAVAVLTY
ncbi:MAG: DUF3667 domain-containing protein [Bacteroidota bacterium]|nr:DUF3667 domain-containing protein [Bacteroidota bacterium]